MENEDYVDSDEDPLSHSLRRCRICNMPLSVYNRSDKCLHLHHLVDLGFNSTTPVPKEKDIKFSTTEEVVSQIVELVASSFDINPNRILAKDKTQPAPIARFLVFYFLQEVTGASKREIGVFIPSLKQCRNASHIRKRIRKALADGDKRIVETFSKLKTNFPPYS